MNQREFFDDHAETWDADRDPAEFATIETLIKAIRIRAHERILDVGTGTGVLFPYFGKARHVAIDASLRMLTKAREKAVGATTLIQSDVCALPFVGNCFDRAVLFAVFPHIGDKRRAMAEIFKVLKPGGRIDIMHSFSRQKINALHRDCGGPVEHDLIPDQETMRNLLAQAGFKSIAIHDLPDRYLASAVK